MADQERIERRIQVANARPEDSGRGLARLPRAAMLELGLVEGDTVEIVGKRVTPSRVVLPYREDEGLDLMRLDGLQRANAGVGSGDFVVVRKAESKPAQRVVFAPAAHNLRLQGNPEALKRSFSGAAGGGGRHRRDRGPAADEQWRHAPGAPPDAERAGLCVAGDPADGSVDGSQGHRHHR